MAGPKVVQKRYPTMLKYHTFVDEEITLLENAGCMSKSLSLWTASVIIVPKN